MAKPIELNLDQDPVDEEALRFHNIAEFPGKRGDPPSEAFIFEGIIATSPVAGDNSVREYTVEVEYRPRRGAPVVTLDSLEQYLHTFEEAKVTMEAMAQTIRTHMSFALNHDDVFVSVKREDGGVKHVELGEL